VNFTEFLSSRYRGILNLWLGQPAVMTYCEYLWAGAVRIDGCRRRKTERNASIITVMFNVSCIYRSDVYI